VVIQVLNLIEIMPLLILRYAKFDQEGRSNYGIAAPKYRVNDKFSIYLIIDYTNKTNDLGWVGFESSDIIIGKK
jgi:hypothetical protein